MDLDFCFNSIDVISFPLRTKRAVLPSRSFASRTDRKRSLALLPPLPRTHVRFSGNENNEMVTESENARKSASLCGILAYRCHQNAEHTGRLTRCRALSHTLLNREKSLTCFYVFYGRGRSFGCALVRSAQDDRQKGLQRTKRRRQHCT